MLLLITQPTNDICFFCVFILMLGAFLIGYFAKSFNVDFSSKKTKDQPKKQETITRIKPLGVIKTRERSGSQVAESNSDNSEN